MTEEAIISAIIDFVKMAKYRVVYHFEIKLTISSTVQIWLLTPAAIAGDLG